MNLRLLLVVSCLSVAAWGQAADNAKPVTHAASKNDSDAVADPLASAKAFFKKGQYEDAATAFKAAIAVKPDFAEAQVGLIRSLLRARQLREAEDAGKKAVAALPASAEVQAAVGDVTFRAGKFGDAEAAYRAAVKADANSARALFGMGRIYDMVSMHKRARDVFARAHELDPADHEIYERWIELLTPAEALEAEKKWVGDHPSARDAERIKYLTTITQKKPWVLSGELKPVEMKLLPYGRTQTGTYDINRSGAETISKGYGLSVKFSDRASAVLLLDTGAGGITIGNKLAERAGAVKIAETYIGGIGDQGPVPSYVAWVDKINIGGLEFRNCTVIVSSKNNVADEAGLIGPDVFEKFLITLDFRNWKMNLTPLPKSPMAPDDDLVAQDRYIAPEMQGFTKVFVFGHDLVVPVLVSDKATGNFILDTGSDLNMMSPVLAEQVTKASYQDNYEMKGVSGRVQKVLTGEKAILQFAKMRVESHDFPVFPMDATSNYEGTEIAGLIGIRTLVQMKMMIDYRDGLVNLEVYEFKKARE